MAGNPKTSKSTAIKGAQMKPGSKGTKVGLNPKATVKSTAVTKMKMGGMAKGKRSC